MNFRNDRLNCSGAEYARCLVVFLLCLVMSSVKSDSWKPAKVSGMSSQNGNITVRVIPGTSIVAANRDSKKVGPRQARAVYYRLVGDVKFVKYQEVFFLNAIAPVFFAVANSGEVATLDNWHGTG